MAPASAYTMRRIEKTQIEHERGTLRCAYCGTPIRVGQRVVTTFRKYRRASNRMYHMTCFKEIAP
jgi:hypothetical protein